MIRKLHLALCVFAIAGQAVSAQNKVEKLLAGDVQVTVLERYSGPEALPKPDRVVVHDFTVPVGAVSTDESIAGQLHRDIMFHRGVDEDSSPQALAGRVQTAFAKALANELKRVKIQTVNDALQGTSAAETTKADPYLVIDGAFTAINEGDETKRILVGFGRGASDIKTHARLSLVTQGHSTV